MKLARLIAHTLVIVLMIALLSIGCRALEARLSGALCLFFGILFGASIDVRAHWINTGRWEWNP